VELEDVGETTVASLLESARERLTSLVAAASRAFDVLLELVRRGGGGTWILKLAARAGKRQLGVKGEISVIWGEKRSYGRSK